MKFEELLHSCSFDDIVPILLELMSDHKDSMQSNRRPTLIKIHITRDEWIDISCIDPEYEGRCGFCYPWDISLGMEVIWDDNVHLSTPEIVAHCIWEMTFYGFSENQIKHQFHIRSEYPQFVVTVL